MLALTSLYVSYSHAFMVDYPFLRGDPTAKYMQADPSVEEESH